MMYDAEQIIERSLRPFRDQDLRRLVEIASKDQDDFLCHRREYAHLRGARIGIALCQGAALHYIDGRNGVKDLDIYVFYRKIPRAKEYYPRRIKHYDFGDNYFGRHPKDEGYIGRRVDVLGRSIDYRTEQDPADALRRYLLRGSGETPRLLAEKAVVLLWPEDRIGEVVWPRQSASVPAARLGWLGR